MAAPNRSVFISFAGEDLFLALSVKRLIEEQAGWTAFVFNRDAPAGAEIDNQIRSAIRDADRFVVIVTPESVKRRYVISEIAMAYGFEKPMIGLLHRMTARRLAAMSDLLSEIRTRNNLPIEDVDQYISGLDDVDEGSD